MTGDFRGLVYTLEGIALKKDAFGDGVEVYARTAERNIYTCGNIRVRMISALALRFCEIIRRTMEVEGQVLACK